MVRSAFAAAALVVVLGGCSGASTPSATVKSAPDARAFVAQPTATITTDSTAPTPSPATVAGAEKTTSGQAPDPAIWPPRPNASLAPTPPASPVAPAPSAGRLFRIDLYRAGVFAAQATKYYCVPAAIEVMENLIGGRPFDTSRATQDSLYADARSYLIAPFFGRAGAQPEGWADVLNADGDGHYEVGIRSSGPAAIKLAALQLRLTGKPVGLLVWAGFHAWVMSGFTSMGDPAKSDFIVTGLYVEDVWWPRPDTSWGPSPRPDTLLSVKQFDRFFLPYRQRHEGGLDKNGKFVVIVPTR